MNSKIIGVLAILGASIMWALEPVFAKLAYVSSDFIRTSTVRAITVTLIALFYVFFSYKGKFMITKKQIPKIIYCGLIAGVFADLLVFFALTKIPVINVVLIGKLQPIFIVLMGFFILKKDKLTKYDYFGIFILIIASLLVTTKTLDNLFDLKLGNIGDLLVLFATFAFATQAITIRKYLRDMNSVVFTFYRFLIPAVLLTTYVILTFGIYFPNMYEILVGVITAIGSVLYFESFKRINAAQVSSLELSTPFFVAIIGFLVIGETITVMQFMGMVLLLIGIYFLSKNQSKKLIL